MGADIHIPARRAALRRHFVRLAAAGLAASLHAFIPAGAAELPSFQELEAQHAIIGEIHVEPRDIFDLEDPQENYKLFRLVNRLHAQTRPRVIERALLFKSGEPVSARLIEETERVLRKNRFLYDVAIRPLAYHGGVVDIEVVTRDTWTLDVTGKYSRSGGTNSSAFGVKEYNLLGTGVRLGLGKLSDVDRRGSELELGYGQAFDGWTVLDYFHANYSDGARDTASVTRPFYALDTRWAAGTTWDDWNRIDSIYNAGDVASQYRHRSKVAEAFAGWSPGLVRGWTQRFSAGAALQDDAYELESGSVAPDVLPVDHSLRGPFVRHEMIEDRYVKLRNRDQIARPEFVEMGFHSRLQVTRSLQGWGASRSAWLYTLSLSRGFVLPWGHDLLATANAQRQLASTANPLDQAGATIKYYAPQTPHAAFYGLLSFDRQGSGGGAPDQLLLGGDNGLRGYPLRYQSGESRALLTLEERVYTDWYPLRLLRVGGAVFFDRGRAWGGVNQNAVNGGWLSDAGIGLRIALDRAAFANVLHADIAMPLDRAPGIKKVQFLVKTQLTF